MTIGSLDQAQRYEMLIIPTRMLELITVDSTFDNRRHDRARCEHVTEGDWSG